MMNIMYMFSEQNDIKDNYSSIWILLSVSLSGNSTVDRKIGDRPKECPHFCHFGQVRVRLKTPLAVRYF